MNRTFDFKFEQYPLQVIDRYEIGMIDGVAEISYTGDGEWAIESIELAGTRYNTWHAREAAEERGKSLGAYTDKRFPLHETSPLYLMVVAVLEGRKRDDVQEAVREQIEEDREEAREFNAEVRRDLSWEARF